MRERFTKSSGGGETRRRRRLTLVSQRRDLDDADRRIGQEADGKGIKQRRGTEGSGADERGIERGAGRMVEIGHEAERDLRGTLNDKKSA
jgi:hypothetical protein